MKRWMAMLLLAAAVFLCLLGKDMTAPQQVKGAALYDKILYFPLSRYPETGDHIRDAIAEGHSDICTIDREGADKRREESLKGIPTKPGYDRDEWPMAVCEEGGAGADVRYVTPSDNRGAGSWVGNQMSSYPDGTKVLFIVQ
ncbi:NucA/NucB deoxyribonuclease domain-containing protein [Bacillus halotolerans]|uniref:NucA/NucB deoxyribonuclease domain-containing protein n=1 Tax=Bacillus halotolerans TaxID=260554 RepID=UPI002DBDE8F9|nr:NucA/NucB deoxyribonuclease domain-containing protein [Bacillus halotolerans]MEC0280478.1 NucA/NucB deoxyribonuclease domain-containing protein [Bacillus halotolerans]